MARFSKPEKTRQVGFAIGSIGDSAGYNFITSFLSFFLTTIAGISPSTAGTIIAVAIVWDAITDPIVGMLVDSSKSKHGKRRPFVLASVAPLGASVILLFQSPKLPQNQLTIYYLILVLLFWTAYTVFNIPYYSIGSVVTTEYDDRLKMAAFREIMGFIGVFCGSALPTFI